MGEKIYYRENDQIRVVSKIKEDAFVRMPLHLIDLWIPLIGSDCMGFYMVLKRFAFEDGRTRKLTIRHLMDITHKNDRTIAKFTEILRNFGFIKTRTPKQEERQKGESILYVLLNPPDSPTQQHIDYAAEQGWTPSRKKWSYEVAAWWLVEDEPEEYDDEDWDDFDFELSYKNDSNAEIYDSKTEIYDSNAEIYDLNVVSNVDSNKDTNINYSEQKCSDDLVSLDEDDSALSSVQPQDEKLSAAEQAKRDRYSSAAKTAQVNQGKATSTDEHTNNTGRIRINSTDPNSLEAYLAQMLRREFGKEQKTITSNQSQELDKRVRVNETGEGPSPRDVWRNTSWRSVYKRYIDTVVPRLLREKLYKSNMTKVIYALNFQYDLHKFFVANGLPNVYPDPNGTPQDVANANQFAGLNWSDPVDHEPYIPEGVETTLEEEIEWGLHNDNPFNRPTEEPRQDE